MEDYKEGCFNYLSYTIHLESDWHMDTGVTDLEVAFLRLILPDLTTYVALDLANTTINYMLLYTHNLDMIQSST